MSKLFLTLAALAGAVIASTSSADARPRVYSCDGVSTWSVCQGGPAGEVHQIHASAPPSHSKPGFDVTRESAIHPEGSGSISSGGGTGGGGGGGGGK